MGTFWSRDGIARQSVEDSNKSTSEFVNSREGVRFATRVLDHSLVSGIKVQPVQLKNSGGGLQQWIESPAPLSVVAGNTGSRSNHSVEAIRVAGIPDSDGVKSVLARCP